MATPFPSRCIRVRHTIVALAIICALSACAVTQNTSRDEPGTGSAPDATGAEALQEAAPVSLEGWPSETFSLPPEFAPELPRGTESLRFAPGWRDPNAEGFWSYAFVMTIDEPAPHGARIDEILEYYYDGLMFTFASNRGRFAGSDPAQVEVRQTAPNRFTAKMHTVDAFATFEPIDIRFQVETVALGEDRSVVRIRLSPQPEEHAIWRSLQAAIESIGALASE